MENKYRMLVDEKYGLIRRLLKLNRYPTQSNLWVYGVISNYISDEDKVVGSGLNKEKAIEHAIENFVLNYCDERFNKDLSRNIIASGIGQAESLEKATELAINNMQENYILDMLKSDDLRLIEIDKKCVEKFCEKYIVNEFKLYKVNSFDKVIILCFGKLFDGKLCTSVAVGSNLYEECKRAIMKLCEVDIKYSNYGSIDSKSVLFNKDISENIVKIDEKSKALDLNKVFKKIHVIDITSEEFKQLNYSVVKCYSE